MRSKLKAQKKKASTLRNLCQAKKLPTALLSMGFNCIPCRHHLHTPFSRSARLSDARLPRPLFSASSPASRAPCACPPGPDPRPPGQTACAFLPSPCHIFQPTTIIAQRSHMRLGCISDQRGVHDTGRREAARAPTKQQMRKLIIFSTHQGMSCVLVVTDPKGGMVAVRIIDSGLTQALVLGHLEEISAISRCCFDLRANATSLAWSP